MDRKDDVLRTCLPQIGAKSPDFSAITTFGNLKLSDFKGKWVVFFSSWRFYSCVYD